MPPTDTPALNRQTRTVASSTVHEGPPATGSGSAGRGHASKSRAMDPGRGAVVMAINGNQNVVRVRESGRGMGVEVTERDHDDDREQGERCDQPSRPITTRQGPNLHQGCRTGGVSRPKASTYTPSHNSSHTPASDKSRHINQIPTQHTTPRCRKKVQGGSRGATLPNPCGLRTRQVFLRHTCRVGSLPSKVSLREGDWGHRKTPCLGLLAVHSGTEPEHLHAASRAEA